MQDKMNAKIKSVLSGIIVFVVLGGLWFFFISRTRPWPLIKHVPNFLFLTSFIAGVAVGFVGDKSGGIVAGIVSFVGNTLMYFFFPLAFKIPISRLELVLSKIGYIIALSSVAFVSAIAVQRIKLSRQNKMNTT